MCQIRDCRLGDEEDVFRIVKHVLAEYGLATKEFIILTGENNSG
jgi:hypothetical protein